jgi:tripartite-type tricarboxylate transporter receptor subunit TctC
MLSGAVLGGPSAARAQQQREAGEWPSRPITLVIPFVPGGTADGAARTIATLLSPRLGQPVIAENRGGAGGTLAAGAVAAAPPDGHTLLDGTIGQLTILPILMRNLPYDAERDFQAVSIVSRGAYGIAVHPGVAVRSVAELIAMARATPSGLPYATAGIGSGPHLAAELFGFMAQVRMTHVPYRGSAPALNDVVSGQVPVSFDNIGSQRPLIQGGRLRGLAVTTASRSALMPELPTVHDTLPGYEVSALGFIATRSGTPRTVIDRLNAALQIVLRDPAAVAYAASIGSEAAGSSPEEATATLRAEAIKWRQVIEHAGIRIE